MHNKKWSENTPNIIKNKALKIPGTKRSWDFGITTKKIVYRTHAIITCGLHIFYPTFHSCLYSRAVYTAEQLVFHDSFSSKATTKNRTGK